MRRVHWLSKGKRVVAALAAATVFALLSAACAAGGGADDAEVADVRIAVALDVLGSGWADSYGSFETLHAQVYRGLLQVAETHRGFIAGDEDAVFGNELEIALTVLETGAHGHEQRLRSAANGGYQLVIGVGMGFSEAAAKIAPDFPETHFVVVEGEPPEGGERANLTMVQFAENEGAFLAGALAGMMLPDLGGSRVGFIAAMEMPQSVARQAGFTAGAMYVNGTLRETDAVVARSISRDPTAFNDPAAAAAIARQLYGDGVAIVFHSAGASSEGIFRAAYEERRWAIGADSDQGVVYATANSAQERAIGERILTSILKRFDSVLVRLSEAFIESNGAIDGGQRVYGIADEAFSVAVNRFNEDLLAPYRERLAELKQLVSSGELLVPRSEAELEAWAEEVF